MPITSCSFSQETLCVNRDFSLQLLHLPYNLVNLSACGIKSHISPNLFLLKSLSNPQITTCLLYCSTNLIILSFRSGKNCASLINICVCGCSTILKLSPINNSDSVSIFIELIEVPSCETILLLPYRVSL